MALFKKSSKQPIVEEASEWPPINELVWIRLPCCETAIHPSRVEDIEDNLLLVAHPQKPHPEPVAPPEVDRTFIMGWREGATTKQARVKLHSTDTRGRVPVWKLKQQARPEKVQRRQFVRVEWDHEITIYLPATTLVGRVLDISEGGLRCAIPPAPEPRSPFFQISFLLDQEQLVLEAEVAWWGELKEPTEIGLRLIDPGRALSDRLRRFAFDQQLKNKQGKDERN